MKYRNRDPQHGAAIDSRHDSLPAPAAPSNSASTRSSSPITWLPPDDVEGSGGRYLDVLATLAFLAGATERIRLGVSVLVLPYRPAVLTAKQVATIQELSGGRMILATGVGWMRREFEALGVDSSERGAITTETLRVIASIVRSDVRRLRWPAGTVSRRSCSCRVHAAADLDRRQRRRTRWLACWSSATDGIRC